MQSGMAKSTSSENEALDEVAGDDDRQSATHRTLKHAAWTAAAGAVAAGLAGAAKALSDRRNGEAKQQGQASSTESKAEAEAEPEAEQEPATEPEPEESETETPPAAEDAPEARDEPEAPPDEPRRGDDADAGSSSTPQGASADEITEITEQARRKLEELLGKEPERVSGFAHANGRWTVMLEVLEVRRVPETTDVLSSYEVAFDDDHNLVSMSEVRRYRRSQIEEGR